MPSCEQTVEIVHCLFHLHAVNWQHIDGLVLHSEGPSPAVDETLWQTQGAETLWPGVSLNDRLVRRRSSPPTHSIAFIPDNHLPDPEIESFPDVLRRSGPQLNRVELGLARHDLYDQASCRSTAILEWNFSNVVTPHRTPAAPSCGTTLLAENGLLFATSENAVRSAASRSFGTPSFLLPGRSICRKLDLAVRWKDNMLHHISCVVDEE